MLYHRSLRIPQHCLLNKRLVWRE